MMRLDRFTEVVQNTSAFHLEEKATAISVPGITVSNNKKQMLRDAKKKQAEYAAERQKYGCEPSTAKMKDKKAASKSALLYDSCDTIDRQLIQLDEFTTMVKNTSAFHLEEKATALPVPGITVSNNKKKMLRDAKRKRSELLKEREKVGCETPSPTQTEQMQDDKAVVNKPPLVSEASDDSDKKMMKPDVLTAKVNSTSAAPMEAKVEAKAAALPVPELTTHDTKASMAGEVKAQEAALEAAHQTEADKTPMPESTVKKVDTKSHASKPLASSEACDAIEEELIKLYEFMIMVKNTSAFHLQEKAAALPVPGITVSNNKKKMLKDAEKKGVELLAERKKQGCETSTK
jgi:glutaredoxin-related protein